METLRNTFVIALALSVCPPAGSAGPPEGRARDVKVATAINTLAMASMLAAGACA